MALQNVLFKLVKELAETDPIVLSNTDGDLTCHYCRATRFFNPPVHQDSCIWWQAKTIMTNIERKKKDHA